MKKCPFKDFAGNDIHHGDVLRNKYGQSLVAVFLQEAPAGCKWQTVYSNLALNGFLDSEVDIFQAVVISSDANRSNDLLKALETITTAAKLGIADQAIHIGEEAIAKYKESQNETI